MSFKLDSFFISMINVVCSGLKDQKQEGICAEYNQILKIVHQNFLVVISIILSRLPKESKENVWAHSLQVILSNKYGKVLKRSEAKSVFTQNNKTIQTSTLTILDKVLTQMDDEDLIPQPLTVSYTQYLTDMRATLL